MGKRRQAHNAKADQAYPDKGPPDEALPSVDGPEPTIGPIVAEAHRRTVKPSGREPGPGEWLAAPFARHAQTIDTYGKGSFNGSTGLTAGEIMPALFRLADQAQHGDLANASHTLAVQAMTLDTIFTEYSRRAAIHTGQNFDAMERYMRLALKAQSQSRATLETLAKLHQPREQTVRHIHVNEGGQAIVADQFHHYAEGAVNGNLDTQPHGKRAQGAPLPCPEPIGQPLPMPRSEGQATLQDARRQG